MAAAACSNSGNLEMETSGWGDWAMTQGLMLAAKPRVEKWQPHGVGWHWLLVEIED